MLYKIRGALLLEYAPLLGIIWYDLTEMYLIKASNLKWAHLHVLILIALYSLNNHSTPTHLKVRLSWRSADHNLSTLWLRKPRKAFRDSMCFQTFQFDRPILSQSK